MQALPDFLNINDPAQNLAGFGATQPPSMAPLLNPDRPPYYAYDGTYIGSGNTCDPISDEPELSGLLVPDILSENRFDYGEDLAAAILGAVYGYARAPDKLWMAALWGLIGYMVPLPTAAWIAFKTVPPIMEAERYRNKG